MHIQCTHTHKETVSALTKEHKKGMNNVWLSSTTSTAKVAVIMPQEVVKLFHSQQAQLKVLYVHLDASHISPRLKCWVEDFLILKHHLQSKYRYNSAQANEAEGTTWSRLFISLNPQSKVKHPNQVLTHLVIGEGHWTNTYYMWCMFCGFSFLEGTIPKGCAIANTITISNEFCMNTLLMQGPMFCFLCTCYLLAYPCSATLKLLSLLWISFSWTYPNSNWNDSSRYLGLFRQDISQPTWPMPSCLVSIFRHLGVQPAVLASSQTIFQKTQAQTSSCRGPPEPQSLDESDEIWSHSQSKKRQQNKSGNKNKQSTSIIEYIIIYTYIYTCFGDPHSHALEHLI